MIGIAVSLPGGGFVGEGLFVGNATVALELQGTVIADNNHIGERLAHF